MEVNQKELAKILGLTDRHIRRLKADYGLFTKDDKKRTYTLEKCVPEYIDYKIEAETKLSKVIDREKEQAEHEEIKKQISKLKLRKLKGELHEAKHVESFLTDMLLAFKKKILSIPSKLAPLLIGEDDFDNVRSLIEKEMYSCLEELSEYDPEKIDPDGLDIPDYDDDEEEGND